MSILKGMEPAVSAPKPEPQYQITVNGTEHVVHSRILPYQEILTLAGYDPTRVITVVVHYPRWSPRPSPRTVTPDQECYVVGGMSIDACDTSNA